MTDSNAILFKQATFEQLAMIIGRQFTGSQITGLFEKSDQLEIRHDGTTKWIFIRAALKELQKQGNTQAIIKFLEAACDPVEYALNSDGNKEIVGKLNKVLRFSYIQMTAEGKIVRESKSEIHAAKSQGNDSSEAFSSGNFHSQAEENGNNINALKTNPIRIFISHSTEDITKAKEIESILNESYIQLFLAHRDIDGGEQWREVIRNEIKDCAAMIVLVTPGFHKSEFTAQEVGAAWVLKKPILAIRVDGAVPMGFITENQWISYNNRYPAQTVGEILKFVLTKIYKDKIMVDMVVDMLKDASSYAESNYLATILASEKSLTKKQLAGIAHAFKTNSQVYDARYTKNKLWHLLDK